MRAAWALIVALLAGCTSAGPPGAPSPSSATYVEPPLPGGTWRDPCPDQDAQPLAVDFQAQALNDSQGRGPGLYRLNPFTFLWVYATYNQTQRQDKVSRLNPVHVARDPDGRLEICTRVDLVTPVQVDGKERTYAVAAQFIATHDMPPGPILFTVNWVAGCNPCAPLPQGNTSVLFE